jgi:predicted MPP superfamily phosphohydrolase
MAWVWLRWLLFAVVLLLTLGLANRFVHRRASVAFGLSRRASKVLGWALGGTLGSLFVLRIIGIFAESADLIGGMAQVAMVVQLGVVIATVLLVPIALIDKIGAMFRRLSESKQAADTGHEPSATMGRRDLLSRGASGAALAIGGGSAMYGALFGRHDYQIEEVAVRLARLPGQLDGFTIAQLSDVHLGMFVGEAEVRAALALTADTRPDLIVLTGDLIDHDGRYCEILGRLIRRLGAIAPVVTIAGNHDYYSGIEHVLATTRRAGGRVLMNDAVYLRDGKLDSVLAAPRRGDKTPGVTLLGVDDAWGARHGGPGPDLARALNRADPEAARVLLCHNPSSFEEHAPHVDLQLSGHTHGGQVNLGIRPVDLLLPHGYVAGHYRHGDSQIYVNRGFGTAGPPARIGAPPEVTKLVLTV